MVNAIIESLLIGLGFFYKALWPILLGVLITAQGRRGGKPLMRRLLQRVLTTKTKERYRC